MDPFTCKYCGQNFGGHKFEGAALLKVHYLSEHLFEEYDKKQQEIKLLALRQKALNSAKSSRKRSHSRTVPSLNADRQNANQKNSESPGAKEQIKPVVGQKMASFKPATEEKCEEDLDEKNKVLSKVCSRLLSMVPKSPIYFSIPVEQYGREYSDIKFYTRFGYRNALEFFQAHLLNDVTIVDEVTKKGGIAKMVMLKEKQKGITHKIPSKMRDKTKNSL